MVEMRSHSSSGRAWGGRTALGRWSVRLAVVFGALLLAGQILVVTGQRGGESFSDNLLLAIPMLGAGIAAVSAGALAIGAIARGERSTIVYAIAALGTLVLAFVAGEVLVPH